MRTKQILAVGALAAGVAYSASAQLALENFDSYTGAGAGAGELHSGGETVGSSGWTVHAGGGLTLNSGLSLSAPNSVTQDATTRASRKTFAGVDGNEIHFQFNFYDANALNTDRSFGRIEAHTGTTYAGALNQLAAIGKYNNITTTKYYGRLAFATGVTYSDGVGTINATWFSLDGAADRSIGWHTAEIIGAPDAANPSTHFSLSYYIDGVLGGKVSNIPNQSFNWTIMGSGLTSPGGGVSFDNVSVAIVPEPSTFALAGLGIVGALVAYRRRK